MSAEQKTKVVFRRWPRSQGGQVLALFPEEPSDFQAFYCMSYERVGQHGAADYVRCLAVTKPATPNEYDSLKKELESLGYVLDVRKRASSEAFQIRRRKAA
jgi:hypothetical protein